MWCDLSYGNENGSGHIKVEKNVSYFYDYVKSNPAMELSSIKLNREKHISYLRKSLKHLPRPWLLYWSLHALELLNYTVVGEEASEIVEFLKKCQNPDGGYGGGPSQYSHLAPTYAAVCALAIIGTKEAFDSIDSE
ncbi:Protein farnesyltransferase subunit beta [Armadillidium vulgare]|nr:Protein farnesyltransferase subunit beta [Armadillidium vulgare]